MAHDLDNAVYVIEFLLDFLESHDIDYDDVKRFVASRGYCLHCYAAIPHGNTHCEGTSDDEDD